MPPSQLYTHAAAARRPILAALQSLAPLIEHEGPHNLCPPPHVFPSASTTEHPSRPVHRAIQNRHRSSQIGYFRPSNAYTVERP